MKYFILSVFVVSFYLKFSNVSAEEFIADPVEILNQYEDDAGWRLLKRGAGPVIGAGLFTTGLVVALSSTDDCNNDEDDEFLCGFGEAIIGGAIMGAGVWIEILSLPMAIGGVFSPFSSAKLNRIRVMTSEKRSQEAELLLSDMASHFKTWRYISASLSAGMGALFMGIGVYEASRSGYSTGYFIIGAIPAVVSVYQFLVPTREENLYKNYGRSKNRRASLSLEPVVIPAAYLLPTEYGAQLRLSF